MTQNSNCLINFFKFCKDLILQLDINTDMYNFEPTPKVIFRIHGTFKFANPTAYGLWTKKNIIISYLTIYS